MAGGVGLHRYDRGERLCSPRSSLQVSRTVTRRCGTYERKMQMFPKSGYDPGITPDWTFLPFMGTLKQLVGSTVAVGLVGLVGAGAVGAVVWGLSTAFGAHRAAQYSKWATIGSVGLAMVVGGISGLVRWAAGVGASW